MKENKMTVLLPVCRTYKHFILFVVLWSTILARYTKQKNILLWFSHSQIFLTNRPFYHCSFSSILWWISNFTSIQFSIFYFYQKKNCGKDERKFTEKKKKKKTGFILGDLRTRPHIKIFPKQSFFRDKKSRRVVKNTKNEWEKVFFLIYFFQIEKWKDVLWLSCLNHWCFIYFYIFLFTLGLLLANVLTQNMSLVKA